MIQALTKALGVSIREVCSTLGVSVSGFYAHRRKSLRPRRQQDEQLAHAMKEVFESSYCCYGSPRLVRALRARGWRCSKTRIRRLMRREGLCARQKRRGKPRTTQSHPYLPVADKLVCASAPPTSPGQQWHSDITYIPTKEGFLYLAATIDAFTRRCAGWCARDNMETALVKEAATMAFSSGDVDGARALHHSDRGSQYASEGFRLLLQKEGIRQSMSRKGNCYDNALGESFWATVKTECFDNFRSGVPESRHQARQMLFRYIELFYNRVRLHSALGYTSPVQFENNWIQQHLTVQAST